MRREDRLNVGLIVAALMATASLRDSLTDCTLTTNNYCVLRSIGHAVVSLTVGPCMVVASVAVPEHVHGRDGAHDHAVVHRHFESHVDADHDHDGPEVSPREGPVTWLDIVGISHAAYTFAAPLPIAFAHIAPPSQPTRWVVARPDHAPLPHGPPAPAPSLRAPPFSV